MKKFSLLSLVLGMMSTLLSVFFLAAYFLPRGGRDNQKLLYLAAGYFAAGLVLLFIRWILTLIQDRNAAHRRSSRKEAADGTDAAPEPRTGSILLVVLGVLAIVSALVLRVQVSALQSQRRGNSRLLEVRLQTAAGDAARDALARIAADEDPAADHTNESWAVSRKVQDPSGIVTRTSVVDQERYFDLNNMASTPDADQRLPSDILMDILTLCGDFTPAQKVDALRDWVDADSEGFAEDLPYREYAAPYAPPNRPLLSWGELLLVEGFTRDYFQPRERYTVNEAYRANPTDCLAVIPGRRTQPVPVNINTAPREVLLGVFGIGNEALVQAILDLRTKSPLVSVDALSIVARDNLLQGVRGYLDVRSRVFVIDALAYADGRTEHLRVLARRGSEGVEILQWVF